MGTLASRLWPPFLQQRPARQDPAPAPPPVSAQPDNPLSDQQQDYLDLQENMRRPPAEVRRTDRFFVLLFCLITLAWIAAAVILWVRR